MSIKITAISGLAGNFKNIVTSGGDLLCILGDYVLDEGTLANNLSLAIWMEQQKYRYKVVLPNYTDINKCPSFKLVFDLFNGYNIKLQLNDKFNVDEYSFYTIVQNEKHRGSYLYKSSSDCAKELNKVGYVDFLLTTAPAQGFLDLYDGVATGLVSINKYVTKYTPKVVISGGKSFGVYCEHKGTRFYNADCNVENKILPINIVED